MGTLRDMAGVVCALLTIVPSIGYAQTTKLSGVATAPEAIAAANARIAAALQNADASAIIEFFAPDSMIVLEGTSFIGIAAVSERLREIVKASGPATRARIETTSLVVDADIATETGHWEYTYSGTSAEGRRLVGRYVVIWRRQADASWKIYRDLRLPIGPG